MLAPAAVSLWQRLRVMIRDQHNLYIHLLHPRGRLLIPRMRCTPGAFCMTRAEAGLAFTHKLKR